MAEEQQGVVGTLLGECAERRIDLSELGGVLGWCVVGIIFIGGFAPFLVSKEMLFVF